MLLKSHKGKENLIGVTIGTWFFLNVIIRSTVGTWLFYDDGIGNLPTVCENDLY